MELGSADSKEFFARLEEMMVHASVAPGVKMFLAKSTFYSSRRLVCLIALIRQAPSGRAIDGSPIAGAWLLEAVEFDRSRKRGAGEIAVEREYQRRSRRQGVPAGLGFQYTLGRHRLLISWVSRCTVQVRPQCSIAGAFNLLM